MEIASATPGNYCWFELVTSDQGAAKTYYGQLFGWEARDAPMGPGNFYTTFELRGRKVGAVYSLMEDQRAAGVPPHWGTYVAVADVEKATAEAKSLGAQVICGPMDVAEHGRSAVLRDPTGAVINLWQAKQHQGIGLWGEVGAFCWAELMTHDTAAARKFYTALFGWKTSEGQGVSVPYTHWQNAGAEIGGMIAIQAAWGQMPSHWNNYVQVANCDETVEKVRSLEGKVCMSPTDLPNTGRFAMVQDPQGAMLSIIELIVKQ